MSPLGGSNNRATDYALPRWLNCQRIGLGAGLLKAYDSVSIPEREQLFAQVWAGADEISRDDQTQYLEELGGYPPAVLESLSAIEERKLGRWAPHRRIWELALTSQRWHGAKGISPICGAKLIADRLLQGMLSPPQLIRMAKLEMRCVWPDTPDVYDALEKLTVGLVASRNNTDARVSALANFSQEVQVSGWNLIENAILQQSYAWPLVVVKAPGGAKQGLALPISFDVEFDAVSDTPNIRAPIGVFHSAAWYDPIRDAVNAAKELWQHQHHSWDGEFREKILRARVNVNLQAAELLVLPYLRWAEFSLDGASLESYLALLTLGAFVGSTAMETSCSTGALGEMFPGGSREDFQPGGDFPVYQPKGLRAKIQTARKAFFFDKIVIPRWRDARDRESDDVAQELEANTTGLLHGGHLRICEGFTLSHFANHIFGQTWRRHRYVRCPDLAYGFKDRNADTSAVGALIKALKTNRHPILTLDDRFSARDVVRALRDINELCTRPESAECGNEELYRNVGTFSVIRTVPDEAHERFWQVVWRAIGGSDEAFFDFKFFVSVKTAAIILARELNSFGHPASPAYLKGRPTRAPDVLVIVGSKNLDMPTNAVPNGPFSRFTPEILFPALASELEPTPIEELRSKIGATRIILVPEEKDIPYTERLENVAPVTRHHRELSVFRHGFTFSMAQAMLAMSPASCQRTLGDLQEKQSIFFAKSTGEYFAATRGSLAPEDSDFGDLHERAAKAIAGFLDRERLGISFNFKETLAPEWLHEAQWHLQQAGSAAVSRSGKLDPVLRQARARRISAHERLSRVGEPLSWSKIRWAVRASNEEGKDTLAALVEHLREVSKRRWLIHPLELVWAAKFAHELAKVGTDVSEIAEPDRLLSQAWAACEHFGRKEADACRFVIATTDTCMKLVNRRADPNRLIAGAKQNEVAQSLLSGAAMIIDPEWFEYNGDFERNDGLAAERYGRALFDPRFNSRGLPLTVIAKFVGARFGSGKEFGDRELAKIREAITERGIRYAQKNVECPTGLAGRDYVERRWTVGRNILVSGSLLKVVRGRMDLSLSESSRGRPFVVTRPSRPAAVRKRKRSVLKLPKPPS